MYQRNRLSKTTLKRNKGYVAESIEEKVNRIVNNKEPIKDGSPPIFTERKDGVKPEHDIRTDRFEIAAEAMDKLDAMNKAKREDSIKARENAKKESNQGLPPTPPVEPNQGT